MVIFRILRRQHLIGSTDSRESVESADSVDIQGVKKAEREAGSNDERGLGQSRARVVNLTGGGEPDRGFWTSVGGTYGGQSLQPHTPSDPWKGRRI